MDEVEITIRFAGHAPLSVKATLTRLNPDASRFLEALDLAYEDARREISREFVVRAHRAKAAA